ncbi:MAG: hypothetical protein O7C58_00900, partial [Rickettsia endosymbiont of Ixodes persulcatus]|nr:hypothetical protein [Rickettsia endosymbiont of Ixodes persulcatus]
QFFGRVIPLEDGVTPWTGGAAPFTGREVTPWTGGETPLVDYNNDYHTDEEYLDRYTNERYADRVNLEGRRGTAIPAAGTISRRGRVGRVGGAIPYRRERGPTTLLTRNEPERSQYVGSRYGGSREQKWMDEEEILPLEPLEDPSDPFSNVEFDIITISLVSSAGKSVSNDPDLDLDFPFINLSFLFFLFFLIFLIDLELDLDLDLDLDFDLDFDLGLDLDLDLVLNLACSVKDFVLYFELTFLLLYFVGFFADNFLVFVDTDDFVSLIFSTSFMGLERTITSLSDPEWGLVLIDFFSVCDVLLLSLSSLTRFNNLSS